MLLSLFQRGLIFNLSGRNSAQTKTTKHGPVKNCGNMNGKKNGNSKIMLLVRGERVISILRIKLTIKQIVMLIKVSHQSKYYPTLVLLPNVNFL